MLGANCVTQDEPQSHDKSVTYALQPHSSMSYAWDYPATRDKKLVISIGNARRVIDILEIGNLIPFKFNVSTLIADP